MFRKNKKMIMITSLITLLPMLIGIILWKKLPDQIPTHFGFDGTPDGFSGKVEVVFGINFFLLICHLLTAGVVAADPKRQNIGERVYRLVLWICPIVSLFIAVSEYSYCLGHEMNMTGFSGLFVGAIFAVIGYILPKCRSNYTVGIRLPWTLDSAENWEATHRMAGPVWMGGGIAMVVLSLAGLQASWTLFGLVLVVVLVPCGYSFVYYMRRK